MIAGCSILDVAAEADLARVIELLVAADLRVVLPGEVSSHLRCL